MKLRELLAEGTEKLNKAGVDNAGFDARQLLMKAYGMTATELLADLDRTICTEADGGAEPAERKLCPGAREARISFYEYIERRSKHIPLQHILGTASFMGFDFKVSSDVLIPRQDTETLAETVLGEERDADIELLDLCTGSGCLAIALKKLGSYKKVTASDISEAALKLAAENAALNKAETEFIRSDMLKDIGGSFDVIVSNPPYIETDVIAELDIEVREYDPGSALDGGKDGLDFYRIIAEQGINALKPGGRIYLEIGCNQGEAVSELLRAHGFSDVRVINDLAGKDRVVAARYLR